MEIYASRLPSGASSSRAALSNTTDLWGALIEQVSLVIAGWLATGERWGVRSCPGISFGQGGYAEVEFILLGNARLKCVGSSVVFAGDVHANLVPLELRREGAAGRARAALRGLRGAAATGVGVL